MTIRVVVADDQELVRSGFAMIVDAQTDMVVVGEAVDGAEAVAVAERERPHVVLMDVRMPRLDGIEATRRILGPDGAGADSPTRVVMLTTFDLDEYVFEALRAGASGFLLKDARPADLLDAVRRTHAGESLFAPGILRRLVEHYLDRPGAAPVPGLGALTGRETEVLALIARGLSNDEIAAALTISIKTVKTHVGHLLAKLAARDRAQLVIAAYRTGLVVP